MYVMLKSDLTSKRNLMIKCTSSKRDLIVKKEPHDKMHLKLKGISL